MKRREFITLLGGAVAAWPLAARAQQADRVRRIGMLMGLDVDDPDAKSEIATFLRALQDLGWTDGRNLQLDYRWGPNVQDRLRRDAMELMALAPDVVVASTGSGVTVLQKASRVVPIVFVGIIDAVQAGRVASLARPGGNATGFMSDDYGISGKLLDLCRAVVPGLRRVAVVRDPTSNGGIGQYAVIEAAAPSLGVELTSIDVRDPVDIERSIAAFARSPDGGLIVPRNALASFHHETIITAANRHRVPAVYPARRFADRGGLISYGPVIGELWHGAAGYVDRILRGAKPGDLPVQAPTRYELVINLKTAKALGLTVPQTLLVAADEVIE
jgi:putative ABC transport system substrate-binding protein